MRQEVRFVAIGEVLAPHGLRGEVRVLPLTDVLERFSTTTEVWVGPPGREPEGAAVAVERVRVAGRFILVKLAGTETVEAAEKLRRRLLFVPRQKVAPLPDGRFFVFDLVGMEVVTEEGAPVGEVTGVLENPANDLFVVRLAQDGREALIPALKSVVREIDLPGGRMVVNLLPGLIEASEGNRREI